MLHENLADVPKHKRERTAEERDVFLGVVPCVAVAVDAASIEAVDMDA